MLPSSAATNASGRKTSSDAASAVPTSTGATAAGSVRGRAATSQSRNGAGPPEIWLSAAAGPSPWRTFGKGHYGRRGNLEKSGLRFST